MVKIMPEQLMGRSNSILGNNGVVVDYFTHYSYKNLPPINY